MFYRSQKHEEIYKSTVNGYHENISFRMLAVLYLLTADHTIWKACRHHIHVEKVNFDNVTLCGVSQDGYAIYTAAKDLYDEGDRLSIADLADKLVISPKTFKLIVTAITLKREGEKYIHENADNHISRQ